MTKSPADTPMMVQYYEVKRQFPDAILFYRVGDFYEMFAEDAVEAARELEITLTQRGGVPLCGVPHHSSNGYLARLVSKGYKVAVCEQVEDPRFAKGIVKREVTKVVTPGVTIDEDLLALREVSVLAGVVEQEGRFGFAVVDFSTGAFRATELDTEDQLREEMLRIEPAEIVLAGAGGKADAALAQRLALWLPKVARRAIVPLAGPLEECLRKHGGEHAEVHLPLGAAAAREAALVALAYLEDTQRGARMPHLRRVDHYVLSDTLLLDPNTKRNLEIVRNLQDGKRYGSLLGVLDRTQTAMGARKLRHWLDYPLVQRAQIEARLDAVAELRSRGFDRDELRAALKAVPDLERMNGRIVLGSANARDLAQLRDGLRGLPGCQERLGGFAAPLLRALAAGIDPLADVGELLARAIVDSPPMTVREGGMIREGFRPDLDELAALARDGKGAIARMEAAERERTKINSLKVGYNKVFGYYIEITNTNKHLAPDDYIRKQTLSNAERYITPALKEWEQKVLHAEERQCELEYQCFLDVRAHVAQQSERIEKTAAALAALDALMSLAQAAEEGRYVRPTMVDAPVIRVTGGRHPVVERVSRDRFVPNDVDLSAHDRQVLLITGPNMAGKSTYMRQVALLALMAQVGSFVPADEAEIGIVDRLFTRVGASDNLVAGQSTFMVEMTETANILRTATDRSLIVLDEIGRGTSTFDGISIAWAVAEFVHDRVGARTLFATHYHELADLARTKPRVRNANVEVREWNDEVIFLRRIIDGAASHSYGIQCGRLAGLPAEVVDRAREVLQNLEKEELNEAGFPKLARTGRRGAAQLVPTPQLGLFEAPAPRKSAVEEELKRIDVNALTPLEALNLLAALKKQLG
jgi:DNA mismatch repair protein MutS